MISRSSAEISRRQLLASGGLAVAAINDYSDCGLYPPRTI
jgi:hypothetical protein